MSTVVENPPRAGRSAHRRRTGWLVQTGRILLALLFAGPLLFLFVSSLKPDLQIFADLRSWRAFVPLGHVSFANYSAVFARVPFARFLMNSIGISVVTVMLGLLVNSLAAFALARLQWRGKQLVLTGIIATLIIPFVANAFSVYLFYQYFTSIPKELDEAARMDGAGWFRIYRNVVMPLSGPAIATVAILTFLPAWNSYLWPLMVVQSEELRPVMLGIQYFFQLNVSWGQVMAYASMITLPVLALFLAFQKAFIGSIASSGVKG